MSNSHKQTNEDLPKAKPSEIKIIMKDYFNLLDHIAHFSNSNEIMDTMTFYHAFYKTLYQTFRKEIRKDESIDYIFDQLQIVKMKALEGIA